MSDSCSTNGVPPDRGLRRQVIVQSLLADVVQGRLRAGQHLVTQDLAERFGVSHTPIREALVALQGVGVIDLLPNRGAIVRQVTAREVCEVCHVRRVLECEAVRRACGRIAPGLLRDVQEELRHLAGQSGRSASRFTARARELDSRLHDLIASSCGNVFLAKELNRLKLLFRAFRDAAWEHEDTRTTFERLSEEAVEHLAIVEALLAGDRRAAMRAMSRHVRSGIRYWSRVVPGTADAAANGNGKSARARRNGVDGTGNGSRETVGVAGAGPTEGSDAPAERSSTRRSRGFAKPPAPATPPTAGRKTRIDQ